MNGILFCKNPAMGGGKLTGRKPFRFVISLYRRSSPFIGGPFCFVKQPDRQQILFCK